MKTRVTFRVNSELADALRELPNQTQFVEDALRQALGRTCPLCEGSGRIPRAGLKVSNVRWAKLAPLDRATALKLKRLVGVGHELGASHLDIARAGQGDDVGFTLRRGPRVLLHGSLRRAAESLEVH